MHRYRTHTCTDLRQSHVGETVRISGWIHRRRDHGQLVFIDLRDHYGITQCVTDVEDPAFQEVEKVRLESVVCITGRVVKRSDETINPKLPTGRCRSTPMRTPARRPACATATWICAASGFTRTSCCAAR